MIHRLIAWIHELTAPRSVRTTICDLPEQYGPRMRVDEMRSYFLDTRNELVIRAVVQVLWMRRRAADESARDGVMQARNAGEIAAFYLGGMEVVDSVLADVQLLMDAKRKPDAEMKQWFRASLGGDGSGEGS